MDRHRRIDMKTREPTAAQVQPGNGNQSRGCITSGIKRRLYLGVATMLAWSRHVRYPRALDGTTSDFGGSTLIGKRHRQRAAKRRRWVTLASVKLPGRRGLAVNCGRTGGNPSACHPGMVRRNLSVRTSRQRKASVTTGTMPVVNETGASVTTKTPPGNVGYGGGGRLFTRLTPARQTGTK